ncbi:MAG: hypothetical protein AAF600_02840 [Bacteroidota bacterium]
METETTDKKSEHSFEIDFDVIKVESSGYAYISKEDFYSHPKVQGILEKAKSLKGALRKK